MNRIITILTIVGMCFGVFFWADGKFAKCEEFKALERRIDAQFTADKLYRYQDRLWQLEDRYGSDPDKVADPEVKKRMKELKSDVESLRIKTNQLDAK